MYCNKQSRYNSLHLSEIFSASSDIKMNSVGSSALIGN